MKLLIKKVLFFAIFLSVVLSSTNSIIDRKNLAKTYYESELYEDAIIILEEILIIEREVFRENNINLLWTVTKLYELNFILGNFDISEKYLQEYINIQSSHILKQQNLFIKPLTTLKEIYINEKKPKLIHNIDSLLTIINSNVSFFTIDSSFALPKLIINTLPNLETETEYSLSDLALEEIKDGINFLNNNLYTESMLSLTAAIKHNAPELNINYFKNINFGVEKNNLYDIFSENIIENMDTINTRIYFYLGLFDYQNENYDQAIKYFSNYNKHYPSDINSLLFLGDIFFERKDWLDATFHFFRATKIDPNNFDANLALAKSLNKLGDYKESNNILKYILIDNTENYELIFNMGYNYYYLEAYNDAIKFLTQSILLDSKEYLNYYYLGLSYLKIDLNKQALDAFKKCVLININFGLSHYELGKIYTSILNEDLAIKHFEFANKNQSFDDLNYRLGVLYFKQDMYFKAMGPLKNYLINNLNNTEVLEMMGEIFVNIQRYPESVDIYERLIEQNPNNELYYNKIANSHYQLKNFDKAIENYKKVLLLNEENYDIYLKIGIILNKRNLFDESEIFLLSALECGPPNKELLIQLGIAYGGQKKFLQSLLVFKKALKFSLEDPVIHYQIAIIYKELDIYDLAIENFSYYLSKNKNDDIALFLIGECYFNKQNYTESINYYKQTSNINSNNIKSLFNIGKCYELLNDKKNAAKYFKNVIKKNPDHVKSREKLINLYIELNKSREAKKECEIIYMLDRYTYNSIDYCRKN